MPGHSPSNTVRRCHDTTSPSSSTPRCRSATHPRPPRSLTDQHRYGRLAAPEQPQGPSDQLVAPRRSARGVRDSEAMSVAPADSRSPARWRDADAPTGVGRDRGEPVAERRRRWGDCVSASLFMPGGVSGRRRGKRGTKEASLGCHDRPVGSRCRVVVKRIYLLRHAKSSWKDAALADHDRPLSSRGRRAATAIGDHLRDQSVEPELVLLLHRPPDPRDVGTDRVRARRRAGERRARPVRRKLAGAACAAPATVRRSRLGAGDWPQSRPGAARARARTAGAGPRRARGQVSDRRFGYARTAGRQLARPRSADGRALGVHAPARSQR